ncbi:MAG: hypothetical protein M3021_11725, partial [Actinomycetota bacterium]|nr:hypothetical protein [Actinomycetota bacterium]
DLDQLRILVKVEPRMPLPDPNTASRKPGIITGRPYHRIPGCAANSAAHLMSASRPSSGNEWNWTWAPPPNSAR